MTGATEMNTQAFLEYFAPLEDFLDKYIVDNNLNVGWDNPNYRTLCM